MFFSRGGCSSRSPSVSHSFAPRTKDDVVTERGGRGVRRRYRYVFFSAVSSRKKNIFFFRRGKSVCILFCVRETVFFPIGLSLSLSFCLCWCRFETRTSKTRALVARGPATRKCSHSRARVFVRVYYIFIYSSSDCVSFWLLSVLLSVTEESASWFETRDHCRRGRGERRRRHRERRRRQHTQCE